jgi:hypothetical protein
MTVATDTKKPLHLASTALDTASNNESIKKALSILLFTYVKVAQTSKAILPTVLTTKLDAVETYVSSLDKKGIADAIDGTVDSVYFFGSDAVTATKEKKLGDFLTDKVLTAAEDLVAPEDKKKESNKALSPSSSSSRLASLGGNVSKKFVQKASEGVTHLRDAVVPPELVHRASDFIDHQVKPQVTYVAALPATVAEKFNATTVATSESIKHASTSVSKGLTTAHNEFHTRVVGVASDVLENNKSESEYVKGKLLLFALANQGRLAWNDFFVVPVSSYLSLPDLKPTTLYNAAINSKHYEAVRKNYASATTAVSEKINYVIALPSVVLDKVIIELRERYVEFTGKDFAPATALPAIVDATKSRVYVAILTVQDYSKVLVKKSVVVASRYLPTRVVKAITSGPLRIIEATEEVIEDN